MGFISYRDVVYLCVTAFVWRVVGCRWNWSFELFFLSFFSLGVLVFVLVLRAACCVSKKFDLNFEFQQ